MNFYPPKIMETMLYLHQKGLLNQVFVFDYYLFMSFM